jgi:flagellar biosynthetic protein FliP
MRLKRLAIRLGAVAAALAVAEPALAQAGAVGPDVTRTALILTLLAVVPAILVSMTSFIRIVIVLSMVRHAFGMPETPPNAVLVSLSLFLTAFTMSPVLNELNRDTLQPLLAGRMGVERAMETGSAPLRKFMLTQTRDADIESMYAISNTPLPERPEQVEILKLAPAFILNELRVAFTIGFVILLPFLLIDLVVSSILLSLGMMMVPPTTISLPIKLLMFVLIDGWKLVLEGVLGSFG